MVEPLFIYFCYFPSKIAYNEKYLCKMEWAFFFFFPQEQEQNKEQERDEREPSDQEQEKKKQEREQMKKGHQLEGATRIDAAVQPFNYCPELLVFDGTGNLIGEGLWTPEVRSARSG